MSWYKLNAIVHVGWVLTAAIKSLMFLKGTRRCRLSRGNCFHFINKLTSYRLILCHNGNPLWFWQMENATLRDLLSNVKTKRDIQSMKEEMAGIFAADSLWWWCGIPSLSSASSLPRMQRQSCWDDWWHASTGPLFPADMHSQPNTFHR